MTDQFRGRDHIGMQRRRGGNFGLITTNIALVGPGAVGTTVAALLYTAGHPVLVCGHTPRDSIELRPDGEDPIVVPGPVTSLGSVCTGPGTTMGSAPSGRSSMLSRGV